MDPTFFPTPKHFRRWLAKHHASGGELWVGFYKKATGRPSITWPESVDEALCFGWIDGVRRSLGDEAYTIRFTPRKPTSIWSAVNVAKIAALRKARKMRPAGERAFALRTPERTGVYSFERKSELSAEHRERLRANRAAAKHFDAQAPWYQRAAVHWVASAKKEETRERRLEHLIACSEAGETIRPLTRPGHPKTRRAARE